MNSISSTVFWLVGEYSSKAHATQDALRCGMRGNRDVVATTDETEGLVVVDLDLSKVEEVRSGIPIGNQKRLDMYKLEQV